MKTTATRAEAQATFDLPEMPERGSPSRRLLAWADAVLLAGGPLREVDRRADNVVSFLPDAARTDLYREALDRRIEARLEKLLREPPSTELIRAAQERAASGDCPEKVASALARLGATPLHAARAAWSCTPARAENDDEPITPRALFASADSGATDFAADPNEAREEQAELDRARRLGRADAGSLEILANLPRGEGFDAFVTGLARRFDLSPLDADNVARSAVNRAVISKDFPPRMPDPTRPDDPFAEIMDCEAAALAERARLRAAEFGPIPPRPPRPDNEEESAEAASPPTSGLLAVPDVEEPVAEEPAAEPASSTPRELTFDLATEPGLLGDVARWCSAMAFRPVQEFSQPAALATLAPVFGRRFATPTGLGLNLYFVILAETGGGKDAVIQAPRTLLAAAGLRHLIGPGDFTSDAAIEVAVRTRPVQLMPLDEFGKLAQAMTGRAAPGFAKLAAKTLLELYPRSAPASEWSGKQRAGDARDSASEVVHSPTLSFIGVSTPGGFFEGMTEATLDDGMLNRFTAVAGGKPGDRQKAPERLIPPAEVVEALKQACEASSAGNLQGALSRDALAAPVIRCVPWADAAAEEALETVETWEDQASDDGRRGICGRAAEQTQKIATIRALARSPADAAVTANDIAWAWAFVRSSIAILESGAREHMSSSSFEELVKAIERNVISAGPEGIAYSKLLEKKTVAKSEPRLVAQALERLRERGVVEVAIGTSARGGRPGKRVRALVDGG